MDAIEVSNAQNALVTDTADPYAFYRAARERGPVVRLAADELTPFPEMAGQLFGREHAYLCVGRDIVLQVLSDWESFAMSKLPSNPLFEAVGESLSLKDGDEHTRLRALVGHAFRPRAVQRWRDEFVEPLAHRLIDEFAADSRVELNGQFAAELPIQVIARILGLPVEEYPSFRSASFDIMGAAVDPERAFAGSRFLKEQVARVIDERSESPGDDLMSDLASVEMDGRRLAMKEIYDIVLQIIIAGNETTFHGLGTLMFGLLTHPSELALVQEDRTLVPQAVDEALRWDPPAHIDPRAASRPTALGDFQLEEDDIVLICLASANRDERYYEDPDRFWIKRPTPRPHVAFAAGPHFCLGAHLARLELETSLAALLDRLPNVRIDPSAGPTPRMQGVGFRGPTHLPLVFDAA